jgi:hypothetical protein
MGRAYSTYVEEKGMVYTGFSWGNLQERAHFKDPGVGRRIILKWLFTI